MGALPELGGGGGFDGAGERAERVDATDGDVGRAIGAGRAARGGTRGGLAISTDGAEVVDAAGSTVGCCGGGATSPCIGDRAVASLTSFASWRSRASAPAPTATVSARAPITIGIAFDLVRAAAARGEWSASRETA